MQGPNVQKLIIEKMAADAIPAGGGLVDGIRFLSSREAVVNGAKRATEWVKLAICAVRTACEPNPWKNATDEEIAGEVLRQIEERKRSNAKAQSR